MDRQHCRYPWPQGTPPVPPSSVTHPEHRETCLISLCHPLLRQSHLLPKKPPGSRGPTAPSPAAPRHSREGARREPAPGPSCGLGNTAKPAGVTAEIRSGIPGRGKGPNLPCCWRRRHSHRGGRARSCRAKPRPSPAAPRTHGPSDSLTVLAEAPAAPGERLQTQTAGLCAVHDMGIEQKCKYKRNTFFFSVL